MNTIASMLMMALLVAGCGVVANGSDSDLARSADGAVGGDLPAASDAAVIGDSMAPADLSATSGEPTARSLLDRVTACAGSATAIKGGFGLDGAGKVSMYQCGAAVYWKADLDVDCDGIQTPPCDRDPQGQPQTSIVDVAPSGDVDPTKLPYFVIPLGNGQAPWYTNFGIELGQVGAVIYNGQVHYGIFADEAGGWFIGESSYAMCQLFLGPPKGGSDPCDPVSGGIDPADVTYVTFTGAPARAAGKEIYDHARHVTLGVAAARAWIAGP